MKMLLANAVFLGSLVFAGCGQEPAGDTKKVSIVGSRAVSKMVEKGTRALGKTFESAKTILMPEIPQPALAVPGGTQLELPTSIGEEKTWLGKDWVSANVTADDGGPVHPNSLEALDRRLWEESKKGKKGKKCKNCGSGESAYDRYRKRYGEYAGKHGQPQPPDY